MVPDARIWANPQLGRPNSSSCAGRTAIARCRILGPNRWTDIRSLDTAWNMDLDAEAYRERKAVMDRIMASLEVKTR